jgi:lipopolysaccharide heptosyltransferase II
MREARRALLAAMAGVARRFDRRGPPSKEVRRVLVCATGGLGNAILLQPLLRALRSGCPAARIDLLLTSRAAADLVRELGWADRVASMVEDEWYEGSALLRRFAGPLRRERYDWVLRTFLTAPGTTRASLAAWLSGAPVRVAYGTAEANGFETHLLAQASQLAETERHLALVEALGLAGPRDWRPEAPPAAGAAWAERFERENGAGRPLVGLHPGSDPRFTAKRWPATRFGELAAGIAARLGALPIVLGGPDDEEAVESTLRAADGAAIPACGQDIGATAGLVARCAAFVTNDSGLMHVAGMLGVPTLALFGPTDPVKNRPLGGTTRILRLGLPCSPCTREHAMNVCDHHDCLRNLETGPVLEALATILAEARGSADRPAAAGGEEVRWRRS